MSVYDFLSEPIHFLFNRLSFQQIKLLFVRTIQWADAKKAVTYLIKPIKIVRHHNHDFDEMARFVSTVFCFAVFCNLCVTHCAEWKRGTKTVHCLSIYDMLKHYLDVIYSLHWFLRRNLDVIYRQRAALCSLVFVVIRNPMSKEKTKDN